MARDPLRYQRPEEPGKRKPGAKRLYLKRRAEAGIPLRCDNPSCMFFTEPLVWAGRRLRLDLDHISGVPEDDRFGNLRLLCPNCHSQQDTRGGGNRGKKELHEGGYSVKRKDGLRDHTPAPESGEYQVTGSPARLSHRKRDGSEEVS